MVIGMLHTDWQITKIDRGEYSDAKLFAAYEWHAVSVPSAVQHTFYGMPAEQLYQLDRVEKLGDTNHYYLYKTSFTTPSAAEHQEISYRFEGIDYSYAIYLNGCLVLEREGMFSAAELPLQPKTAYELLVVVKPFFETRALPENVKCRMTAGYGWDFAPKIMTAGIWNEAGLVIREKTYIKNIKLSTKLFSPGRAEVSITVALSGPTQNGRILVKIADVERTFQLTADTEPVLRFTLNNPRLWWPNGMGEPYLYDLSLTLVHDGGEDTLTAKVGLRTVERTLCEGQSPYDTPCQYLINGQKVFLKGANWVPMDACLGSIDDSRYELFLTQFKTANFNCIRVWGGGIKERKRFYDLADEMGLMVIQEFPLSCQNISESGRFLALLEQEVTAYIEELQFHPCIILWTGGNEHFHFWQAVNSGTPVMNKIKEQIKLLFNIADDNREWRGGADKDQHAALNLMAGLTDKMDAARPFNVTSAMEGEGEAHGIWTWNPVIGDHRFRDFATLYDYWRSAEQSFYSECSVPSMANLDTLKWVFDSETPPKADPNNPIYRLHHGFDAAWDSADTWIDLPSMEKLFGTELTVQQQVAASHWMQAEGARFLIEELRRKTGRTSGVLWWGINEPWPSLGGNTVVDYFGRPKPALKAMANSFKPVILSLRYTNCVLRSFVPELWVSNDRNLPFNGSYRVSVTDEAGKLTDQYSGRISCGGYQSLPIRTLTPIDLPAGSLLTARLTLSDESGILHENEYEFASAHSEIPYPQIPDTFSR